MLNELMLKLSIDKLKDVLLLELTILHIAFVYILMYVVYKALGRYIYFKPQEHASKVNRTFLVLSLLIVSLHTLSKFTDYLPILPEHRWLYIVCGLVLIIAPLSIIMDRVIWKYDPHGGRSKRNWCYYYLPISSDYYKTTISKSESKGNYSHEWEEEGVESTRKNIHSDALLNVLALIIFITVSWNWAYSSVESYGWPSLIFFVGIPLPIAGIFFDRAVFSWIEYLTKRK